MTSMSNARRNALRVKAKALLYELVTGPLYVTHILPNEDTPDLLQVLRTFNGNIDHFCPKCNRDSLWALDAHFLAKTKSEIENNELVWYRPFFLVLACARNAGHRAWYSINCAPGRETGEFEFDTEITKFGQTPSLRDFAAGDIKEFSAVSPGLRREYMQAINTGAHGFNVAACVHYRRVFEGILSEVRDEHLKETGKKTWREFDHAQLATKIELLRGRLPSFLHEHPQLYNVLSAGVHELTEDECKEELPTVRQAIEIIFKDRLRQLEERRTRELTSKMLADSMSRQGKRKAKKAEGDINPSS